MKVNLDQIIHNKKQELKEKKKKRDFLSAIKNSQKGDISIIAEIKLASPSEGKLGLEKDIANRARIYERGGADAISVVVDKKYFNGDPAFIRRVKKAVSLPVLTKDFIIDPYQIHEMKYYGADAILLIARILPLGKLIKFVKLTKGLHMEPVVEAQNKRELDRAVGTNARCIAVNARDLNTFKLDIDKACGLIRIIPQKFTVLGFSGISNRSDVAKYKNAGARGILIGTSLMKSKSVKKFLTSLRGAERRSNL